jgi:hydroxypyruvate isomerase
MRRREFTSGLISAGLAGITAACNSTNDADSAPQSSPVPRKGRLKQSATRGVFGPKMPFDRMCREAARLGCKAFDYTGRKELPTLKKYGLVSSLYPADAGIVGMNHTERHDRLERIVRGTIDDAAANGIPNILCAAGARKNTSYEEGADNCVTFFNRVKGYAEDKNVTLCMEILNSKYDHPDEMCDHTAWGVGVCKRVNSPRVKLLFDIYHVQIMDGDVCNNIRNNFHWIAHFHTAGVPGRHEIDDTQELNYRFVARTILELGYTGFLAHEYYPAPGRDPIHSLDQAIGIMDV